MGVIAPAIPPRVPIGAALFLDFDGTLVPIAQRPQDVHVAGWVVPTLGRLQQALDGALAIVSGRPLDDIDEFLHPLVLPGAGAHGAERRAASGLIELRRAEAPADLVRCADALAARHPGLILERKPGGFALHFRLAPEWGKMCHEVLADALARSPADALVWELLSGHCVCELKQRGVSKGKAVQSYLAEPPFVGRVPVFIGDDVTDEDGIVAVQAAGGFGIRVGPGSTQARFGLQDTDAVASWLQAAAGATGARNGGERHEA